MFEAMKNEQPQQLVVTKEKQHFVMQPNAVARTRQPYNLIEKKILIMVMSQIKKGKQIQLDFFKNIIVELPLTESAFNSRNYQSLRKALDTLLTTPIILIDDIKFQAYDKIMPFSRIQYDRTKSNKVKFHLNNDSIEFFVDVKNGFTNYLRGIAMQFESVYTIQMYELLSRWKDKKRWPNVPIELLKSILGVTDKYERFVDFRKRILMVAHDEMAEKADIRFDFTLRKQGRDYKYIDFDIYPNKNDGSEYLNELMELHPNEQMVEIYLALAQYKFRKDQIDQIIKSTELTSKFVEIHGRIMADPAIVKKDKTALVVKHLKLK